MGWFTRALMNWLNQYLTENKNAGDEGIDCSGELHIGMPGEGRELVVGEGDSHTVGMKVFSTSDDVSYTDNTVAASSGSGSTYETFNGTITVGSTDYMGSDLPLCGIKLNNAVLVVPGTGTVAREYWNGSAWTAFTAMVTKSNVPYTQLADNIGTFVGSEQVRFGGCDDQAKTTVNGENKYWVRFRITSEIDSVGEVEQVKLHTNRWECNADGFTEYFGEGIYEKDLVMHWNLTDALLGFSPANENITFASGLTLTYSDNEFSYLAIDGRGGYIIIPSGLDTSREINFEFLWTPLNDVAGNVAYQLITYQARVGEVIDSGNSVTTTNGLAAVALNSDNLLIKTIVPVNAEKLLPGEVLAVGFKRLGTDGSDTYSGNIAMVNVRAIGYFWKP